MPSETADERAARRRATWRGATTDQPMQAADSTVEERVLSMRELAETGWALLGRPLPDYTRADMPGRVLRPGDGA